MQARRGQQGVVFLDGHVHVAPGPVSLASAMALVKALRSFTLGATLIWAIAAAVFPVLSTVITLADHSFLLRTTAFSCSTGEGSIVREHGPPVWMGSGMGGTIDHGFR